MRFFDEVLTINELHQARRELQAEIQQQFEERRNYIFEQGSSYKPVRLIQHSDIYKEELPTQLLLVPTGANENSSVLKITVTTDGGSPISEANY